MLFSHAGMLSTVGPFFKAVLGRVDSSFLLYRGTPLRPPHLPRSKSHHLAIPPGSVSGGAGAGTSSGSSSGSSSSSGGSSSGGSCSSNNGVELEDVVLQAAEVIEQVLSD